VEIDFELLKTGDRKALDEACDILFSTSLSVCKPYHSSFNHHEIEDIAIEATTKTLPYIKKVNSFAECKGVLVQITRNAITSRHRKSLAIKHGGGKVDSLDDKVDFQATDGDQISPALAMVEADEARLIHQALHQVSSQYRPVLEDFYFNGLSYREIAVRHSLSVNSVGVYLGRGLEEMAEILKEVGFTGLKN